jgi:internalin A
MRKKQAIWVVLATYISFCSASAADVEKVLTFPTDRAVGQVQSMPKSLGGFGFDANWYDGWEDLGPAQGEIKIPADHLVRLNISKVASSDLSFLEKLDPTAINVLMLRGTDVTDDGLRFLTGLTNLQFLDLEQTKITDTCAPHFADLKNLVHVDFAAFDVNEEGFGVGDKVLAVLATLPKLSSVELRLTKVTDAGMAELARSSSLESVSVEGTEVTDAGLPHLAKLKNLKSLSLGVYNEGAKITDEGLKIAGQMTGLQSLQLSGTPITDAGLPYLSELRNLKSLQLDETKATSAGLAFLEPLQNIQHLRLMDTVDDEGARHLAKLKNLKSVTANMDLSDEGVGYLAALPHLEQLMLSDEKVTDASLPAIAKMAALKTLWFQRCKVTDEGLAKLTGHPTLEYMLFRELPMTTASLETFATLPKLKILNIALDQSDKSKIDWSGLEKLTQIERLGIEARTFTADDLRPLQRLKQLQGIEVECMDLLDDEAMLALADLGNLKNIDLRSTKVTDKGMVSLSNKPKLEYMTISCQATDTGLKALYDSKSLQYLQIASPYITDKGLAALAEALPSLQDINVYNYSLEGYPVSAVSKDEFLRKGERDTRSAKDTLEDNPAPKFTIDSWFNLDQSELQVADLQGKVVVVYFWEASDNRSIDMIGKLKHLHDENNERGLAIVAIHSSKDPVAAEMYVSPLLMPWPVGIDKEDKTKTSWKVDSCPSFYLVDRGGKLRFADLFPGQLEEAVEQLIEEDANTFGR